MLLKIFRILDYIFSSIAVFFEDLADNRDIRKQNRIRVILKDIKGEN